MNNIFMLSLLLAVAIVNGEIKSETYNTDNDTFDIHAMVADDKRLKTFIGCFLDTHECEKAAAAFKLIVGDAVQTACVKCTKPQKFMGHIFLEAVKTRLPDQYAAFKNKYDPDGTHYADFEAALGFIAL